MKRLVVTVVLVSCLARGWAMPTKAELTKAQPLVVELMAPAMEAYKSATAKDKTAAAVKVGDASSEFAKAAETESARFLLLKGAVNFYTRGEAYDKAADAADEIRASIRDIDPAVLAEIISKATVRATSKKAPRLWAIYRQAKTQVKAAADSKSLANQLKAKPDSLSLRRTYAEALAVSGDWKAALSEFAKLNDNTAKMAKAETGGTAKSTDLGEFWWTYESTYDGLGDAFKMHAVSHYRRALAEGEIKGLKKNIVDQRLSNYQGILTPALPVVNSANKSLFEIPKQGRGADVDLLLGEGEKFTFISCPAGAYKMGSGDGIKGGLYWAHRVNITRPFWMAKYPTTYAQYRAITGKTRTEMNKMVKPPVPWDILGGKNSPVGFYWDDIEPFIGSLNEKFKNVLPQGYVFRLPSEAEWEYCLKSGEDEFLDVNSVRYREENVIFKERVSVFEKKIGKKVDLSAPWVVPLFAVGTKRGTDWGFHDMLGNGWEFMLDVIPNEINGRKVDWKNPKEISELYEKGDDPLLFDQSKNGRVIKRGMGFGSVKYKGCTIEKIAEAKNFTAFQPDCHVRLVIGPDLVREWKAKQQANSAATQTSAANSSAPKIVGVSPANGDQAVDAGVGEVVVRFDRSMQTGLSLTGFDWSKIAVGKPKWDEAMTTLRVPVKLKPMTRYQLGFNSRSHMNFKSKEGVPLAPYMHEFRTK